MLMLVVLTNRMLGLIIYRQIEFLQIDQDRLKFSMLYGKFMKPSGNGWPHPTRAGTADNDVKSKSHVFPFFM
jgi:hypothetical protein